MLKAASAEVLPRFQFREQDIYTRPPFRQLADDPVYSSFVMKDWQQERAKAEAERKKAVKAEAELEAERERARKLVARLRELGIDPESL